MKYIDEYRDGDAAQKISRSLAGITTRPHSIMEVCGGQTHTIMKYGVNDLLPAEVSLLHGPGCPVCVTPAELIDKAAEIAAHPEVILCSFGDMLRVPGTNKDLFSARADGCDVRVVYSPLDALNLAKEHPQKEVVFFAIGFETTAPANAVAVYQAKRAGIMNFSQLVSLMMIPPAIEVILNSQDNRIEGLLAPGHVCTVTGCGEYEKLAHKHGIPIVVTGFEPVDILMGIHRCVSQLEAGCAEVENQYSRSVRFEGNREAQQLMSEVFCTIPRKWRGIGTIEASGLALAPDYIDFDAERRFGAVVYREVEISPCISGLVLRGVKKPPECPAFADNCTPERPLGAPMVSSEGTCAAYYQYRKNHLQDVP